MRAMGMPGVLCQVCAAGGQPCFRSLRISPKASSAKRALQGRTGVCESRWCCVRVVWLRRAPSVFHRGEPFRLGSLSTGLTCLEKVYGRCDPEEVGCVSATGGGPLCLGVTVVLGLVVACGCGSCPLSCLGGVEREFVHVEGLSVAGMAVRGVSGALGGGGGLWRDGPAAQV